MDRHRIVQFCMWHRKLENGITYISNSTEEIDLPGESRTSFSDDQKSFSDKPTANWAGRSNLPWGLRAVKSTRADWESTNSPNLPRQRCRKTGDTLHAFLSASLLATGWNEGRVSGSPLSRCNSVAKFFFGCLRGKVVFLRLDANRHRNFGGDLPDVRQRRQ